ncbi:MBL fold metallo-hydrolase [Kitasatospora sp. NA04385]|uniref:MBL fold metallo-hydrolase n=1 Tax=Kitasatospora sp. NA04385 TaxID=2742135 RepID=UPI0020CAFAC2|nr:MBL fold metallo-hydrolase [Kitasatospora sp. NA04385]
MSTRVLRFGDPHVNFHLLVDGTDLTLVDAGLPSHLPLLEAGLERIGRRLDDLRAVLVTHGHLDHLGLAGPLTQRTGAEVWVHAEDAPLLADPLRGNAKSPTEGNVLRYALRRPSALRTPVHFARRGMLRTRPVRAPRTFRGGEQLDVPGRPFAVHAPGHTPGSAVFLLPGGAAAFTGDALVTADTVGGRSGPSLVCRAFTRDSAQALRSLEAMADLDADTVHPGHGEPWPGGLADAARRALAAGQV